MNTFLKGLLALIFMFVLTSIQQTGIPTTVIGWELLGITTVGTVVVYVAQSLILPTTSLPGSINILDFLKGLIIIIGNYLATILATNLTGTIIDVKTLVLGIVAIIVAYMVKQFNVKPALTT